MSKEKEWCDCYLDGGSPVSVNCDVCGVNKR